MNSPADILSHLAELRRAAVFYEVEARAEADRLAKAGDYAASLQIDGEADTLDNIMYGCTDAMEFLRSSVGDERFAEIEFRYAGEFVPDCGKRTWFGKYAAILETDRAMLESIEEFADAFEEVDTLWFVVSALSRRK